MQSCAIRLCAAFVLLFLGGCQTYYFANEEFNRAFQSGNFATAEKWLENHQPRKRAKDKFLYHANMGMVQFIENKSIESNEAFEKAFLLAEDFENNPGEYAASLITNPNRITYVGERYERLMLCYFKALNHFKNNQIENGLVETRRLIGKLNVLLEKEKKDNYHTDAFILWMVGTFFEASGEPNNAFIFYKKAKQAYAGSFGAITKIALPHQLKADLIRAAYESGFPQEAEAFEAEFNLKNEPQKKGYGTVLVLWHKGLGPVKDENRISLQFVHGAGGQMMFTNDELGFSAPFAIPAGQSVSNFVDMKFITMAIPKYRNRNTYYNQLGLQVGTQSYSFQKATNLEEVAKTDLKDRIGKEIGTAVARVATKQVVQFAATRATEAAVESGGGGNKKKKQEQAELAGSLVNLALTIANASTEVADTRNWQTLPAEIELVRISLPAGKQTLVMQGNAKGGQSFTQSVEVTVGEGQTVFHSIHTF